MTCRVATRALVWLCLIAPQASFGELSGYLKSFAIRQDAIDTPFVDTGILYQSQNSLRLMWQTFGDNTAWQLHYEVSPVFNSRTLPFNNATFATSEGSYRLSDPDVQLNDEADKHQVFQNLDRLNVQFNLEAGDLTIGRQAITFGSARVINPVDVFLPFDVRTFNQEYRIGVDAVRFQYPFGQLGEVDVGIVFGDGARSKNSAAFVQVRDNVSGHDLQLSLIRFAEQNLIGAGIQSSLWSLGAWMEAARVSGDQDYWRGSTGVDYAFSENVYGLIEYHYNGAGTGEPGRYILQSTTLPYRRGGVFLLGRHYLIPALSWQLSPIWTISLQSLTNLDDHSAFYSLSAEFNAAENVYADFGYYHFRGEPVRESFSGTPVLASEYGTNPDILFVSLKYYF